MSMKNWNDYRRQLVAGIGDLAKLTPDTVRGYTVLRDAGAKTGHLDAKTRALIALAVAITLRCDGCITIHAEAARKLGVTPGKLAEALGVWRYRSTPVLPSSTPPVHSMRSSRRRKPELCRKRNGQPTQFTRRDYQACHAGASSRPPCWEMR
jgi:AhpD family alkylhydroperoxidase